MTAQLDTTGADRHGTWYSFDTPYQRLRLFSPWSIAGFGVAVGLGLLLVYPHRTLGDRLASNELNSKPDRLTVEYLKVFLKAEPGAGALRAALVDQLVRLGSYGEARGAMRPLLNSAVAAERLDAQWLELSMLEQEAFAEPENSSERAARLTRMRAQLALLLRISQDSQHLLVLGRKALAAGDPVIAAQAFQRLAARPEILPSAIYAEAARAALGLGNYTTGANLYFRAMQYSQVLDARRDYYLSALRTLQAGGLYDELIRAADEHLGVLGDDTPTLMFLARMAQSANKLDAAERYAKRLLRLSAQMGGPVPHSVRSVAWQTPAQFYAGLNQAVVGPVRLRRASADVTAVPHSAAERGWLPFDEQAYSLSFNIFLANGNLTDARRVAEKAVHQQPDNPLWRKRLAQVNDWNNAPAAALPQWLSYAQLTGDEAAWDTVMRLAIGLNDAATQLLVIEHKISSDPNNPTWLNQLVAIREAAGDPEQALALLRSRVASHAAHGPQRQQELELLAGLAERSGHDDEALAALQSLQTEFGPFTRYALRIANQFYRQGQLAAAFAALDRAAPIATPTEADFWRTYAELARLLQNDGAAKKGYRQLLAGEAQSDNDLLNLIALLDARQPLAAARLAEYGFARSSNPRFATQAISLYARLADWPAARALLGRMSAAQIAVLEKDASFLSTRASIAQVSGDVRGAARDLRAALALRPDDMELRAGLLWAMIADRDTDALKRALALWATDAETSRVLWDPYAAAMMSINRQDQALHWFRKSGFQRDDYLWLMAYAEALDATSQREQAWRIRWHVWMDLRKPEVLAKANPEQLGAMRDRLVALSPLFMNGDGAERVIQALLRADVSTLKALPAPVDLPRNGKEMLALLDRSATVGNARGEALTKSDALAAQLQRAARQGTDPATALLAAGDGSRPHDDARMTATARELALAYALNRNANALASVWFATRFAAQLSKPLWGELSLILLADDRAQLNRLLDDLPDWLPMYDRIEAAQRAGRPALAQTLAFDQLARLPHDQDLHERLTNLTVEQPANFSAGVTQQNQSPLQTRESHLHTGLDLTPGLKLSVSLSDSKYRSTDVDALTNLPRQDRTLVLTLRKRLETGFVAVTAGRRQSAVSNSGLRLEYSLSPLSAIAVTGSLGLRQIASESALLRVAALRDGIETSASWNLSRAEYARLGLGWHRYVSQSGTVLGTGANWNAEVGSHLRIEYPNLTVRLYASGARYDDRARIDAPISGLLPVGIDPLGYRVLPQNDRLVGLSLGVGTVIENRYSRAWRPFGEIGVTHSQIVGSGYNLRGGVAGSVLGQDLMTLRGMHVSGTAAAPQGSQEFGLDYQWFF